MSTADKIAKMIFKKEPAKPCSISLSIEEYMDIKEIFEMLLMILFEMLIMNQFDRLLMC